MENFQRVTAFEKSSPPIPCNKLPKVKKGGLPLCLEVTLEGILRLLTPTFMKPSLSVGRLLRTPAVCSDLWRAGFHLTF